MALVRSEKQVAWFRSALQIPAPPAPRPQPADSPAAAELILQELRSHDSEIPEQTRTRLLAPPSTAIATLVLWHGFTNAPTQFLAVAEALASAGLRVLLPRLPGHGHADVLNRDLNRLTTEQLVAHADRCIDIAAGFGDPVWVAGLSAGGTLAAWAAATRAEVVRATLMAPLVAPKGFPLPLVRAFVRFPAIVPKFYLWWDPRKRENLGHSPYVYPGFPVPGIMPFLHLSESLFDHSVNAAHHLERVVLTSNPGDFAIRRDAAREFADTVFGRRCDVLGEAHIDSTLRWMHDFVDPWAPGTGSTEQVTAVVLAGLGIGAPDAGGVLVAPLVTAQPA